MLVIQIDDYSKRSPRSYINIVSLTMELNESINKSRIDDLVHHAAYLAIWNRKCTINLPDDQYELRVGIFCKGIQLP